MLYFWIIYKLFREVSILLGLAVSSGRILAFPFPHYLSQKDTLSHPGQTALAVRKSDSLHSSETNQKPFEQCGILRCTTYLKEEV